MIHESKQTQVNGVCATDVSHKPLFKLPDDFTGTHDDYLRHICKAGLRRRYGIDADASVHTMEEQGILDRMERELKTIAEASRANDLLILWDLLWNTERDTWRWYNIGFGLMCGSLVAYLMPIQDVDPLKYNLLFERFLCKERRFYFSLDIMGETYHDIIFRWVQRCYGVDNVARLNTKDRPLDSWRTTTILIDTALTDLCSVEREADGSLVCDIDWPEIDQRGILAITCWGTNGRIEETLYNYLKYHAGKVVEKDFQDTIPDVFDALTGDFFTEEYKGLSEFIQNGNPRSLEDLCALYVMCNPPSRAEYYKDFFRRRLGASPVVYKMSELEPILKETYGVILYDEQFMQVVHMMTGWSLGQADCVRRSIMKRKELAIATWHEKFCEAARERGYDDACIESIWEELSSSGKWSFVKAAAIAHVLFLYRAACIKKHFAKR